MNTDQYIYIEEVWSWVKLEELNKYEYRLFITKEGNIEDNERQTIGLVRSLGIDRDIQTNDRQKVKSKVQKNV